MRVKEVYMFAEELVERIKDGEIDYDEAILEMSSEFAIAERFIIQILDDAVCDLSKNSYPLISPSTYEYVL